MLCQVNRIHLPRYVHILIRSLARVYFQSQSSPLPDASVKYMNYIFLSFANSYVENV